MRLKLPFSIQHTTWLLIPQPENKRNYLEEVSSPILEKWAAPCTRPTLPLSETLEERKETREAPRFKSTKLSSWSVIEPSFGSYRRFKKEAEAAPAAAPATAWSAAGPWPQDGQKGQQLLGGPTAIQDKPVIPHQSLPLSSTTHPCPSPATSPEMTLHQLFLFTNRDPKLNPQHCMHLHSTPARLPPTLTPELSS